MQTIVKMCSFKRELDAGYKLVEKMQFHFRGRAFY